MKNSNMCEAFGINFDIERYSKDKKTIADTIGMNTLNKMQSCFKWTGLPETIPQKWLELMLMSKGFAFITEADGKLYAFWGGLGGEPDEYYQPTKCVIANPALKFNKECNIKEDGVLISNDVLRQGIIPTVGKYAGLLAENTITIRIADIMARLTNLMSAGDESTVASCKEYLKQLEDGKLGVIEESPFLQDLKVQTAATQTGSTRLTDLIEMEQYLKASMLNELGLQANYNMKRESINAQEAQLGEDALQPFIDNMLTCRREACEALNEKYGLNVSVEFNSAWKENEETREAELKTIQSEAESMENSEDTPEDVETPEVTEETPEEITEETPEEDVPEEEPSEDNPEETPEVEVKVTVEVTQEDNGNDDTEDPDDSGEVSSPGDTDELQDQEDG